MNRLPLHQDLYLIAHTEAGKLLTHQSSLALGLAGAVLAELILDDRVAVVQGRVTVFERGRTGDPIADAMVGLIPRDRDHEDVKFWIKTAAKDIYERTRDDLVAKGVLAPVTKRRMGMLPYLRYQLTDITWAVRASSGVRAAAESWKEADTRCAVLCGLVSVLRVEAELYLNQPAGKLIERLRAIADADSPEAKQVVDLVDTLVAEAAVAIYR
ncbi:GOLPH3/VPS74 family protein [Nonomuraea rhodomycinica]|uniref:GPP34 family phosphoprotein n=1 Tax=Nonomuraea rhodomycinica TaxID=1712872 RepID=A0A7Y6IX04_9ACTN|nr:GPP34 family phosphoprotein [Nonomuraea rhodomycinica]NUW45895.1 GPP34 family phosphoprotein [Nonomuraea rhodomycinica]